MTELWKAAEQRSREWDAAAVDYDRFRPRYPDQLFDDLIALEGLPDNPRAVEIGMGTGIATLPLVERGCQVTGIEPSAGMATVAEAKLAGQARILIGTFEDALLDAGADLVVAFNSWHWVDPARAVDRLAEVLRPGGWVGLVWTEVVSWGQAPFESAVAERLGATWPRDFDLVAQSAVSIADDPRFGPLTQRRYRFSRQLDAETYLAVTRTYGGPHTEERDAVIRQTINDLCGGVVRKTEDAVLYLCQEASGPVGSAPQRA